MKQKISPQEFYNNMAADYDAVLEDTNCNAQHVNEAVKIFNRYNHHQGNLLDIVCGTGNLSQLL